MPVPGPRTQARPDEGYRNPDGELPLRFRLYAPRHLAMAGESPGTMETTLRGGILAAGQVRRLWRQAVQYIPASPPFSWTANRPGRGGPLPGASEGYEITRGLRYLTRSLYMPGGADNTRLSELHTRVTPRVRSLPVTTAAGSVRSRPTVRNRLTSFGSRVEPINEDVEGAS